MTVKPLSPSASERSETEGKRFDGAVLNARVKTKSNDDRTATDNEQWPPVDETQVEPALDGKIRYEVDGKGVVVERSVNPELYQFLVNLYNLNKSPEQKAQVVAAMKGDHAIADRNTESMKWDDYDQFQWKGDLENAEVITYTTKDGKAVTVSKALTPELFAALQPMALSRYTLEKRADDGREVAGADTYIADHDISTFGWPDEFGNGVIQFETRDGKKYVVSQFQNKEMYDRVASIRSDYNKSQGSIQDIRDKYNLPDLDSLDLLNKKTGEKADKDDKESMSVVELATKRLLDKYKKLVDDGKVDKNSDVYKLVKAIEAKATMDGGHTITPYIEDPRGGTTWRQFGDGETLSKEDMQDILNGNSVDKLLNDLFTNGKGEKDKIGKEYQAELDEAIKKVGSEDKKQLADQLYNTLTSSDYVKYLAELKKSGMDSEAKAEVAGLSSSLEMLDPERARKAEAQLQQNGIVAEIDTLLGDPGAIPDQYKELAYKDFGALVKTLLKSADIPRRVADSIEKFYNELLNDKTKLDDFNKLTERLNSGEITQDKYNEEITGKYKPLDVSSNDFAKAVGTLNKYGVLGSVSAFGSLGGAIYALSARNGQLADEPLERLAIARDFIGFLGAGAQFEKSKVFDLMTGTNTAELLGLSKTLPDIWGKESSLGKKIEKFLHEKGISGVPEPAAERVNSLIEMGSLHGSGTGDVVDDIRLSADGSGLGTLDDTASRALLDDIVTRAGGTPPSDYSRYQTLSQLAQEQGFELTDQIINDSINERRAANGLGNIPDDESVAEFTERVQDAAHRTPSINSSVFADSIYQGIVEHFESHNLTPPSRQSFDQIWNDPEHYRSSGAPVGGEELAHPDTFELDRESINEMYELDNRTPPAADAIDQVLDPINDSIRNNPPTPSVIDTGTVQDALTTPDKPAVKPGVAAKIGGSLTKVLGVAPDLLSIADIVVGGLAIKDAIKSGSALGKANGALQVVSGAAGFGAGVIGTLGLVANIGALAGATGPLFLITAGLGLITGIIGIFVDHEKRQKATDKEGQWFKDLADIGLTQDDWGDKLEYARYSFYEYDGRDAPSGQSIFDYQNDEWEHFRQTPQEGGSSVNRLDDDRHLNTYDKAFYQDNREVIHAIREYWDAWNGKDDIVSKKDLKKIAEGGGSEQEKAAARFLLDNSGFFDQLDTQWGKGGQDGKVSTNDLNTWLKIVGAHEDGYGRGFFDDNKGVIDTIRDRWDDWNGKDDIVSKKDLEKIANGNGSDAEKKAARFLLDNQGFFDQLDNLAKNDRRDGKISTGDLDTWLKAIGVEKTDKSDLTYKPSDDVPAWRVMRG